MRTRLFLLFITAIVAGLQSGMAAAQPPPSPYTNGGRMIFVNGRWFPREAVFRVLPVTLPLANIRVTSLYGMRVNPITHSGVEFHPGLDLGAPIGTPVYSTADGIVTFVGQRGDYGNMVEVTHGLHYKTRSSHLNSIAVQVGQMVERNTIIGEVGNSGRSTGPHLYWEIWNKETKIDPVNFVLRAYELYHHFD
jgi:murein DD-endopeptidase MepM/ murein hydrolase activator NlpD